MKIAVVADSHDRVPEALLQAIRGADEIWHLGDVTTPASWLKFATLGPPVLLVRGNCDAEPSWPMTMTFARVGFSFLLIHIPPALSTLGGGGKWGGADFVLHGHTHVPRNEIIGGTRFLNPGCITRPNRGAPASFAWLQVVPGEELQWTLVPLASLPD